MAVVGVLFLGLAVLGILTSFVCQIIVLVDAFQNDITKGLLSLFIPFYVLYYAFAEYESQNKAGVLIGWFGGVAFAIFMGIVGMVMAGAGSSH